MAGSGMILIREVADAPVIMGISKPAGLKSPCGEVKIMNPLFVGIDVSSRNNVAYLMKPDGSRHSSFSVQNNLGGAKLLSERIVSAPGSMQLSDVVIGLEATSIYGDSLVYDNSPQSTINWSNLCFFINTPIIIISPYFFQHI